MMFYCRLERLTSSIPMRHGASAVEGVASSEEELRQLASVNNVPDGMSIDDAINEYNIQFDGEPHVWLDASCSTFKMSKHYVGDKKEAFIIHREFARIHYAPSEKFSMSSVVAKGRFDA